MVQVQGSDDENNRLQ